MTMQRRHFELIAATLKATKPDARIDGAEAYARWNIIVDEFCRNLRATNANFKRETFTKACGCED